MCVIILNCVTLGMYQPCSDEVCTSVRCRVLESFDHFIFAFFAIEMLIKMVAMGVWGKDTYLAEAWNRLDCFIVVAGTIEYAVDTENLSLSAIRTIRVLRPLRAINRIPSMRILVMLLLDTLPMLGNVLLLCFFVFFIFGIIGVQLWSGVLRHRCFFALNESYNKPSYVPDYYIPSRGKTEYICSSENNSGIRTCIGSEFPLYEYEGIKCNGSARINSNNTPTNDSCVNWNQYYTRCEARAENPFMGAVSFDNIGLAWVAIFQVISLESWVNIMYYVQDAHSFWDFTYFVALIVIGSFFMINLCLVVIATQFSETKKRETERMMQERKRFQSCSTLASNSEPGGCYTELLKLVAQVYRRVKRKVIKAYYKTRGLQKINPEKSLSLRRKKAKRKGSRPVSGGARTSGTYSAPCCARTSGHASSLKSQQQQPQQQQQQANSSSSASASSRQQSFSYAPPTTVHHHQHQHLVPSPSPQPHQQQQQQQHQQHSQSSNPPHVHHLPHTENTGAGGGGGLRRSSLSRPPSSIVVQAPTASPEQSDIDSMSSPRCPNFLALPSSPYSPLHPSSDSLAALSHLSVDAAFVPALLLKSPHQPHSPNQLGFPAAPPLTLSRASSYNSGVSGNGARATMPSLPEVLAAQGAKNAALAASNMLLNLDYEPSKSQSLADKGLFADNLLMDIVGDSSKQLTAQLSLQAGETEGGGGNTATRNCQQQQQQQQPSDNLDSASCCAGGGGAGGGAVTHSGGSGGCGAGEKEFAGELQQLPCTAVSTTGAALAAGISPANTATNPGITTTPGGAVVTSGSTIYTAPSSVVIASGPCDDYDSDVELSKDESSGHSRSKLLTGLQKRLRRLVESKFFQRSILLAILLNTLSMAVEHHDQPELLTLILEYSNIVFCVLFGAEMAFKIFSYGIFGYISNGFNVFDSFIVILSIVELAQGGASGLSVLRTFRLLRILKLVRFMPALRRQLVVMLRTMDNVATFFALLVLFMFIFSILGMSLFGCKFCHKLDDGKRKCDRKNFDSLLWAIITVFQVLTQEDWNSVLYNGMNRTSHWASLYFIALMTFGNYVLFNLLVAILVEGFSTEDEDKRKEKNKEEEDDEDDEDAEDDEEEQEKRRLAENNNIDDIQLPKSRLNSVDLDVKNNKEKEKKMLALPAPTSSAPPDQAAQKSQLEVSPAHLSPNLPHEAGPRNPPIITHTAATPMATPQGSPNENAIKDTNNHKMSLAVKRSALKSTLSVDSDKSTSLSFRGGSPRPSPCLRRNSSRGSTHHNRSASWRARNRRLRGDKTSLVVDSQSDSAEEVEDDVFTSGHSQSPTYSAGTPRTPSVNTHGDCNGHPPLNNQRTLSPQNSLKGRALTPRNSFKSYHSWSRNNSVGSGRSICNSFELSRQNSFTSHRTLNSLGSGNSKEDNRSTKNFVDLPDVKIALDKEEGREDEDEDEVDPDAIDETDWNCSWLPEPTGCFLTRHEFSFYLLSNDNRLRKWCHHMISRRWFDNAVLFFIALNCITLAMERPDIPPGSVERQFLTYSNYIFTVVFTSEMAIKVVAKGLIVGKHAYLKSGWNVMDGFLVIISLIDIFISLTAASSPRIFGILRVFRLLRTLRPLRVISRAPGLKLVVQTLLSSLRPIGNIVLICCTFFIIFGILGVQLFKGTFYYCKGPEVLHVKNKTMCEAIKGNEWINQKYNFDNLGMALMALFVLASKDGWVQIMYTGLDAVGVDQQPIENYNEWRLIYFISFLLLVAFFVLNMFVGVVVENFHKCRESQEIEERAKRAAKRQEKLDKKRKSEENSRSLASQEMREPPYWAHYSTSRLLIHTVINSKYFDLAIAAVIGLNVITMAMEYYMMPEELKFALKIFNFFFTSVFILEAVMKIVALGFYRYIKDRWNQLDIMIVILSIVGIILEEMRTNVIPINPTIIRVMRVLRIARVLKLLKMAKGIRALLDTVIQALPQVGNLGLLFFLLFFIFAALGVELFGRLECSNEHPCEGLGVHAHFQHFGLAFLTLFRVATGDNWNGIMKDTLRDKCDRSDNCLKNCCVSPFIAPVYFVVFVLMAQFVLVNVVVAVLMKHLEETYKYKELDDELEEELQAEMCALALAGKATPAAGMDIKESHRMMDEEAILLDEALAAENVIKTDTEGNDSGAGGEKSGGLQMSTLPSFSFSVRPPSEEQTRSEDTGALSPINASLTIECMASSWSSMDSNRLGVSPGSLTATSGSSPCSERSVRISSPPIRRAPSPYLLSLQGGGHGGGGAGGGSGGHHFHPSRHHHPASGPQRMASLGSSLGHQRRPLVKQYSMDVGSDPQLNQLPLNSSMPDVCNGHGSSRPRSGLPPYYPHCQQHIQQQQQQLTQLFRSRNQGKTAIYRSQPSLKDMKSGGSSNLGPTSGSLDSSNTSRTGDVSSAANSDRVVPAKDRIKHKLLRSRSSGAKYSRFRDKYKQSNLNKNNQLNSSDTSLTKEKGVGAGGKHRGAVAGSNRTGSNDTGSDVEESLFSDWGSEEAACDLEVKMITGGTEDEEDDIRPTLSPYASLDAAGGPSDVVATGNRRPSAVDSTGSSSASTPRGENTPRLIKQSSHPKCKSPMPPALKATSRRSSTNSSNPPGIDNTSFEMGEDNLQLHQHPHPSSYRVPCKSPRPSVVRRSNSFSPSKLIPKSFSPPMISTRSERTSHSPYQSISPLALPPSPLALEDSTYKLRTPDGGLASSSHSPVPFSHSHMLSVPSPHSLHPYMRSPSPTPPGRQVHLALPAVELGPSSGSGNTGGGASGPGIIRRQPSPALRRQQTLTRSFAVDESGPPPTSASPSAPSSSSPSSSLRRRIPHTLSVDSAFLAPPSMGHGSPYAINDPYLEVHAGCRAPSPLPSPRNSQQTLPGMFTRSVSPAVPVNPHYTQPAQPRSQSFSSSPLQSQPFPSGMSSPPPKRHEDKPQQHERLQPQQLCLTISSPSPCPLDEQRTQDSNLPLPLPPCENQKQPELQQQQQQHQQQQQQQQQPEQQSQPQSSKPPHSLVPQLVIPTPTTISSVQTDNEVSSSIATPVFDPNAKSQSQNSSSHRSNESSLTRNQTRESGEGQTGSETSADGSTTGLEQAGTREQQTSDDCDRSKQSL